jgi:hypothetical protein
MRPTPLLLIAIALAAEANGALAEPVPESPGPTDTPVEPSSTRQSRDDAWWTGPLLAASPGSLPQGHWLIEPYVFDAIPRGHYDNDGRRISASSHQNDFGSQSYVLYGLTDKVSVGLIPRFGFNEESEGLSSSHVGIGDLTLQAQYGLTQFDESRPIPTTAIVIGETLPTGKYDRLGERTADGLGGGVYTTILSLYSQYFLWMPNGRILRTRLDLSYSIPGSAGVHDTSVYGTTAGFSGRAQPGNSLLLDCAWEYSVTRNWVLALDIAYEHDSNTRVTGFYAADLAEPGSVAGLSPSSLDSGADRTLSLAPAVEYNFNSRVGVIAGAKVTVSGRNTTAEIIPVAAINIVI